jgi:hypothetical protein
MTIGTTAAKHRSAGTTSHRNVAKGMAGREVADE